MLNAAWIRPVVRPELANPHGDHVVIVNRGVRAVCPLETGARGHLRNDALIAG